MAAFTARSYRDDDELEAIADLINTCESLDQLDQGTSPAALRAHFEDHEAEPELNIRLWQGTDGQLLGYAQLFVDEPDGVVEGRLRIHVHPIARESQLGDAMVAWGEERMRAIGHARGLPARIRSLGRGDIPYRLNLVGRHGFTPQRSFLRMVHPLNNELPEPLFPAGYAARPLDGTAEAEAWTALFNTSFRDHWNHSDYTLDGVRRWLAAPDYRPDLNLVAVAPDGQLAGFCWCSISSDDGGTSTAEGWVNELGTHPAFRRRGLGRAILLSGLHRMRAAGVPIAKLGVDADSPTGATRLYAAAGFEVAYRQITSVKQL